MSQGLSDSQFNMWRAVIAMIHADSVVRPHEVNFILENTRELPLSDEQRGMLNDDILRPANIDPLFKAITNPKDKEQFFHLAKAIAWSDGDFNERERDMLHALSMIPHSAKDEELMNEAFKSFADIYMGDRNSSQKEYGAEVSRLIKGLINKARLSV